ncbi:Protein-glutamate methylesterase [Roseomonas mucosa]|uniref:chemotaxis-specific protein-glutamate methyltransferase CheB n=1 Tax=Roseomonas mucosa TaxID=207340 RepID=UPI00220DDD34|nr:chemotaxis-specific protein-glutamate methyltransferase CheB [Roseomonas mucosa]QDJ09491.1 Protein-glutamate methylesterase [Roseomonas mucosa]
MTPAPVRVMLCDDSLTVRAAFGRILEADPGLRIVARAGDGRAALAAFAALPVAERPEVVLLDLEMPVMDGMTALPHLLRCEPRPSVIVASSLTQRGAAMAMAALRAGAVDYMPKPVAAAGGVAGQAFGTELVEKVKGWARMRRSTPRPAAVPPPPQRGRQEAQVLAIGSSTGGPQALAALLRGLGAAPPVPVLAVQHMPAGFPSMLADHLSRLGVLPVREARDGEVLHPGRLYLAPGDRHMLAVRDGRALVSRLSDAPPENFCRPAVDPMLRSLVAAFGGGVLAVILTGMGSDGLAGSRAVAAAGGTVLAQDEASSVVWGMPGAVARAGLAEAVLPPEGLAERLRQQRWAFARRGAAGVEA